MAKVTELGYFIVHFLLHLFIVIEYHGLSLGILKSIFVFGVVSNSQVTLTILL